MHAPSILALAAAAAAAPRELAPTGPNLTFISPTLSDARPTDLTGWFIRNMSRQCAADGRSCTYAFGIESFIHPLVQCTYKVAGSSAATSTVSNIYCGPFTISSGWSGQFGLGQGFTTWSVTDYKYIAWPSYSDHDLANGVIVQPDRNYTVYSLY